MCLKNTFLQKKRVFKGKRIRISVDVARGSTAAERTHFKTLNMTMHTWYNAVSCLPAYLRLLAC